MLPKMNGFEVTQKLKEKFSHKNFLILTGYPMIDQESLPDKNIKLKSKPIRINELLNEIRSMIR